MSDHLGTFGSSLVKANRSTLLPMLSGALAHVEDIVTLRRLDRSAGRRDWYVLRRADDVDEILGEARPRDMLTFFLKPQLPIRETITTQVVEELRTLLARVPPNTSELVVGELVPGQARLGACEGYSRHELPDLLSWLDARFGHDVIAGLHPPLLSRDPMELFSAVVPNGEGVIELGMY